MEFRGRFSKSLLYLLSLSLISIGLSATGSVTKSASSVQVEERTWRVYVRPGDALLLNCSGHPHVESRTDGPVNIRWLHNQHNVQLLDGRRKIHANGSLLIENVRAASRDEDAVVEAADDILAGDEWDDGEYFCLVDETFGTTAHLPIEVVIARMSASFTHQPETQTAQEGSNVRFTCQTSAVPIPTYTWYFNDTLLPYKSKRHIQLVNGILQLLNVSSSDGGYYSCEAENIRSTRRSKNAILTVTKFNNSEGNQLKRNWTTKFLSSPPSQLVIKAKESMIIECLVNYGLSFSSKVKWYRKSGKVLPTGNRSGVHGECNLFIENVQTKDTDIYVCSVSWDQKVIEQETELSIQVPPAFTVPLQNLTKPKADTARFECPVLGTPAPTVRWLKNGRLLSNNGRIRIRLGPQGGDHLLISQAVISDAGVYQCLARNAAGQAIQSARFTINTSANQPEAPFGLSASTRSSSSISLEWEPGHSPIPINAYTIHYAPTNGGLELTLVTLNTTALVGRLRPFTNYTFYVRMYNAKSASEPSEAVRQTTGEDIPVAIPELTLEPLDSRSLRCSWSKLSAAHARGHITSYRLHYKRAEQKSYRVHELQPDRTQFTLLDLQPGAVYQVQVFAATASGYPKTDDPHWPWVEQKMPTEDSEVPLLSTLDLIAVNATTVRASWSLAAANQTALDAVVVDGYRLSFITSRLQAARGGGERGGPSTPNVTRNFTLPADCNDKIFTGLEPNSRYVVRIVAYHKDRNGSELVRSIVTLPERQASYGNGSKVDNGSDEVKRHSNDRVEEEEEEALKPPSDLEAIPLDGHAIQLFWNEVTSTGGKLDMYTVRYRPIYLGEKSSSSAETDGNYSLIRSTGIGIRVEGLRPSTLYEFSVARNEAATGRESPYSPRVECKTKQGVPTEPLAVRGRIVNATSVRLTWSPPRKTNGPLSGYQILYTVSDSKAALDRWTVSEESTTQRSLSTIVSKLSPNTQYYFRVRARNVAGLGPASSPLTMYLTRKIFNKKKKRNKHSPSAGPGSNSPVLFSSYDQATGIVVGLVIGLLFFILFMLIFAYRSRLFTVFRHRQVNRNNGPARGPPQSHLPSMYGEVVGTTRGAGGAGAVVEEEKEMESFTSLLGCNGGGGGDDDGGLEEVPALANGSIRMSNGTANNEQAVSGRFAGSTTRSNGVRSPNDQSALPLLDDHHYHHHLHHLHQPHVLDQAHGQEGFLIEGHRITPENCAPGRTPCI